MPLLCLKGRDYFHADQTQMKDVWQIGRSPVQLAIVSCGCEAIGTNVFILAPGYWHVDPPDMKLTASIYIHCDPTASHYLKLLMDAVFGPQNIRNETTWKRTFAHGNVGWDYGSIADVILSYSKGEQYV